MVSPEPRRWPGEQGWLSAWVSRVPCPAPLAPRPTVGPSSSFQAAWEPRQEACHPQQALARLSAHLRALTAGEGGWGGSPPEEQFRLLLATVWSAWGPGWWGLHTKLPSSHWPEPCSFLPHPTPTPPALGPQLGQLFQDQFGETGLRARRESRQVPGSIGAESLAWGHPSSRVGGVGDGG